MKSFFISLSSLVIFLSSCQSEEPVNNSGDLLNGARGKIFRVNSAMRSFEILKETVFDPKTNEGKSRQKVYWTEKTKFTIVVEQKERNCGDRTGEALLIHGYSPGFIF